LNPHYRKHGKIQTPLSDSKFIEIMQKGPFCKQIHQAYTSLLYYSAIRKSEGLRVVKQDFQTVSDNIVFDVGQRLKHSLRTPPLYIPLDAPYVDCLSEAIENAKKKKRIFNFSKKTAYNILDRLGYYPHFFRLSRITNFFLEGWTVVQVKSWTGLNLKNLDYYVGLVDVKRMGESLAKKKRGGDVS